MNYVQFFGAINIYWLGIIEVYMQSSVWDPPRHFR